MVLRGEGITLKDLELDGALVIETKSNAKVVVDGLKVRNAGWKWQALKPHKPMTEEQAMR